MRSASNAQHVTSGASPRLKRWPLPKPFRRRWVSERSIASSKYTEPWDSPRSWRSRRRGKCFDFFWWLMVQLRFCEDW